MKKIPVVLAILLSTVSLRAESSLLRPGDAITLTFSVEHDKLDGLYSVNRDGTIPLPFVGSISAEGLDEAQLARSIEQKYLEMEIYSRLKVTVARSMNEFITMPNPGGSGTIRVPRTSPMAPSRRQGDFFTPKEKGWLQAIQPRVTLE